MSSSDESAPAARRNGEHNSESESSDDLLFKFPQRGESVQLGYTVIGSHVTDPVVGAALTGMLVGWCRERKGVALKIRAACVCVCECVSNSKAPDMNATAGYRALSLRLHTIKPFFVLHTRDAPRGEGVHF